MLSSLTAHYKDNLRTAITDFFNSEAHMNSSIRLAIKRGTFDKDLIDLFVNDILLAGIFVSGRKTYSIAYEMSCESHYEWDRDSIIDVFGLRYGESINSLIMYYENTINYLGSSYCDIFDIAINFKLTEDRDYFIPLTKFEYNVDDFYAIDDYSITDYGLVAIERFKYIINQDLDAFMHRAINYIVLNAATQDGKFIEFFTKKFGYSYVVKEEYQNGDVEDIFLNKEYNFWDMYIEYLSEKR